MAGGEGLEPSLTVLETDMLPITSNPYGAALHPTHRLLHILLCLGVASLTVHSFAIHLGWPTELESVTFGATIRRSAN